MDHKFLRYEQKKRVDKKDKKLIVEEERREDERLWEIGNGKEEQKLEGCVSNSNDSTGDREEDERQIKILR